MIARKPPPEKGESGAVVLWFTLPIVPAVAAFITVTVYIAQRDRLPGLARDYAFLIGAVTAVLAWAGLSLAFFRRYVDPRKANTRVYDEICDHYQQLDARLSVL